MRLTSASVRIALCLGLLAVMPAIGLADVLHMHNGKVVRGKLSRMTGDLIEFKRELLQPATTFKRITLTNRRDVVETRSGKKYFGEIVYVDRFMIDMMTSTGRVEIKRWSVRNVVLGTPAQQPGDFMESAEQQTSRNSLSTPQPADIPVSYPAKTAAPATSEQRVNLEEAEDFDAIPRDF